MIAFRCAPKWVLVIAIENPRPKVGEIEIVENNPCGVGRVINHNSKVIDGLQDGDVVYFDHRNCHPIRLQLGVLHGLIHEENIVGISPGAEVVTKEKRVPVSAAEQGMQPIVVAKPGILN